MWPREEKRFLRSLLICVSVLLACMNVYHMHSWLLWRPEEGTGSPDLKLQVVLAIMWVLGNKLRFPRESSKCFEAFVYLSSPNPSYLGILSFLYR